MELCSLFDSSESTFIANPKGEGIVFNYMKVEVSEDNKVELWRSMSIPKPWR